MYPIGASVAEGVSYLNIKMEIDEMVCQSIKNALNKGETPDQRPKVDLKAKFVNWEKKRIELMSLLMHSGAVEVRKKG